MKLWDTKHSDEDGATFGVAPFLHGIGFALLWCGCFLLWENWYAGDEVAHWSSRVAEIAGFALVGIFARHQRCSAKSMASLAMGLQLASFGLRAAGVGIGLGAMASGLCSGLAAALFLCGALLAFSVMRPRVSQILIVGAFLLSHAIAVAANLFVAGSLATVDSLLLLGGSLLLFLTCSASPSLPEAAGGEEGGDEEDEVSCWELMRPMVAPSLVFALLCGAATQVFIEGASSAVSYVVADAAAGLALVILLGLALARTEVTVETSTLVVLPVFAVIMLAASLLPFGAQIDIGVCIRASFTVVQVLLWVYFAREGCTVGATVLAAFAFSYALLRGAVLLGRIVSGGVCSMLGIDAFSTLLLVLVTLWLLSVTALLFRAMRVGKQLDLRTASESSHAAAEVPGPSVYDVLGERYGLSPRETNIMRAFATGRSASYIGKELYLSESTVRTYIRRSYQKMDIHSRQELMDLIEEMESGETAPR